MFKTGLQFSQITEKLDYTTEEELISVLIDPTTGEIINYSVFTPRNRITWNRYKHLDVPLLLGYQMGEGPWRLNVNGGVYINIESWQRGEILSPYTEELVNFTTAQPDAVEVFRRNVGLSAYASFAGTYQFADKMQLVIEPYYRHFLNAHTIESYGLDQRYRTFGVLTGVRFTL